MTTVSQHLKCLNFERLIGLSDFDFEDTLVTRIYFRGVYVWTVILKIENNAAKVNAGETGNIHDMQLMV